MLTAKLSLRFTILIALTLSCLATVEAQVSSQISSRKGYQAGATAQPVWKSSHFDANRSGSFRSKLIAWQDEDEVVDRRNKSSIKPSSSQGAGEDVEQDIKQDDRLDRRLDDDLDFDQAALDLDDEEPQRRDRPVFGPWPRKRIGEIRIDIRETSANVPDDLSSQLLASNYSDWSGFHPQEKVFAWAAPDIRYQPLYFEDVALERYGTTAGPYHQSLISAFHFAKDFVFLTHKMRHDAPRDCDHPLGFCRPGNSTPYAFQRHYFGRPRFSR